MSSSSATEIKCGVYDVGLSSRAIAPIHHTDASLSYFLVGSCAAHDGTTRNQLALLSYGEDKTFLNCAGVLPHEGEVIAISTPGNAASTDDIIASSNKSGGSSSASPYRFFSTTHTTAANPNQVTSSVFRLKNMVGGDGPSIEKVCALPIGCTSVVWNPLKIDSSEIRVVLADNVIGIADYAATTNGDGGSGGGGSGPCASVISKYTLPGIDNSSASSSSLLASLMQPTVISWDPIYNDRIIVGKGTNLFQIDTRSKNSESASGAGASTSSAATLLCPTAHGYGSIRTIHSNRNELNLLVTGGDDGSIAFWDLRKAGNGPLLSHRVHDHWVQKVCFNRMSSKTLLTCSSDRSAKVYHLGHAVPWGEGSKGGNDDGHSHHGGNGSANNSTSASQTLTSSSLGDFGDSVVDCCWSAASPFVTAAVSYNGKVIVGTVNKATRDGIYGL